MGEVTFGLSRVGQIAIPVTDIERAITYYRDVLGMHFLFQATPPGLGFFDLDGVRLMLDAPAKSNSESLSSIVYFQVADIEAAHVALSARGVQFETRPQLMAKMPDHELWMTFFRDLDRNLLALMSEVSDT